MVANPQGEPRTGAFEVVLKGESSGGELLWSKFATGEPSNMRAASAVAQTIVEDLKVKA